jgi:hydrogenase expression/formation protein HypC
MCLALPAKILEVNGNDPLTREAEVDFGGVRRRISLACVPEAQEGDWVMIHAGIAISRLDEDEAQQVLTDLRKLSEADRRRP